MPHVGFQKRAFGKREDIDEKALEMKFKKKVDRKSAPHKRKRDITWETAPSIPSAHNQKLRATDDDDFDQFEGTTSGSTVIKAKNKPNKGTEEEQPVEVSP